MGFFSCQGTDGSSKKTDFLISDSLTLRNYDELIFLFLPFSLSHRSIYYFEPLLKEVILRTSNNQSRQENRNYLFEEFVSPSTNKIIIVISYLICLVRFGTLRKNPNVIIFHWIWLIVFIVSELFYWNYLRTQPLYFGTYCARTSPYPYTFTENWISFAVCGCISWFPLESFVFI